MKLNKKKYQIIKTKKYIKKNKLFFFLDTVTRTKQGIEFNFFKIFNKIANKKLKNSIFKNMKETINGLTFFIKLTIKTTLKKDILLPCFLAIKINNKIYPKIVFKNINSTNYTNNALLFYQYNLTNLKYHKKIFRNNVI